MKKINSFVFSLVFILAVAVSSFASDGYGVGDQVSDFSISNYDGNSYTLSQSGGDVTVVVFMSTECPFVQPYTDRLNALVNEFSSQGIVFWGMNSNNTESTDEVEKHAAGKGYTFPILKDNNNVVADQFGAQRTPEVFVIDNSTMTILYHGSVDDDKVVDNVSKQYLKDALTQFKNGEAIAVAETKAFGCSIKR
jgi:peroxiredoxin